ncbi:MAG: lacto-N-biose phosphorylase central domain-containing protein, partial [Suipraeoptans sp.]
MPATRAKLDWMEFVNEFVIEFATKLINIVKQYGKKAYVFYDDSWIGLEPYKDNFKKFEFDGLIKCVFSGYEARLCAGVEVPTHELRLHPYLFPVGLGGAPTFMEGGDPTSDTKKYWIGVRRALLRAPIQRIGLGGYLHLTEDFPEFQDYIEEISDEFRKIEMYHKSGKPYVLKPRVAVLHRWGKLRTWTLSGHFHETYMHDLIHVLEALSGLPFDVDFIDFDDVRDGKLCEYNVVINAGAAGTAWSGGDAWQDEKVITNLTKWIANEGTFIGINEPSATPGYSRYFRMGEILGVDKNTMSEVCHGKWSFEIEKIEGLLPDGYSIPKKASVSMTDGKAIVLDADSSEIKLAINKFGSGCGVYLSGFEFSKSNTAMLLNLILYGTKSTQRNYLTDNVNTECAYFPDAKKLVVINNSDKEQVTNIETEFGTKKVSIEAYEQMSVELRR